MITFEIIGRGGVRILNGSELVLILVPNIKKGARFVHIYVIGMKVGLLNHKPSSTIAYL